MAILPISSVSFKNTTPANFTSRRGNDMEGNEFTPSIRRGTTDLAKMPVVVLLAMTPAMADAKMPKLPELENLPAIEIAETQTPETDAMTYIIAPKAQETQQSKAPYGWECLKYENIKLAHKFNVKGQEYNLLFTSKSKSNDVKFVYIIPTNTTGGKEIGDIPPAVQQLVYHDLGKDKEFCGAIIEEDLINSKTNKYEGTLRYELKLPDETAQKLLDLLLDNSEFDNKTLVTLKKTNSPNLTPMEVYE